MSVTFNFRDTYVFLVCFIYISSIPYYSSAIPTLEDGEFINISLSNYNTTNSEGQVIKSSIQLLPLSTVVLNIIQIPETARYIILQTHAFQFNVTLSYNKALNPHYYVNGTNIGLVQIVDTEQHDVKFYLQNPNERTNVSVLITVQAYGDDAPVPGGCNMEFSVEIAPYMKLSFTDSVVVVDSQPSSVSPPRKLPPPTCETQHVEHEMYHMYLPERDFSSETYFDAILKMMTVQNIQLNGRKVPQPVDGSHMRRIYSAYPGTGSVYAVIARSGKSAAAYVPTVTYACSTVFWTDTCEVLSTTFTKVLCAVIFFLGLFVCLFGHQFFKTEMFLLGFLSGGLVFYIVIALLSSFSGSVTIVLSVILGLCFGAVWLGLWCCYGVPVVSILLATLTLGFVVAGIAAYAWLGDMDILKTELNFWMVFTCIVVAASVLLLAVIQKANFISCAVLGAYAVVIPIDHYIGSNLKYIVVNVVRRATVKDFRLAVVDPPFQSRDLILCAVWIALAVIGITKQWYQQRGKPPFPPPPFLRYRDRYQRRRFPHSNSIPTEHTPLLTEAHIPPTRMPYLAAAGDDNVFESPVGSSNHRSFFRKWLSS